AAALAGIRVARVQVLAFVVSAACAGLAGGLLAVVVGSAGPGRFSLTLAGPLPAARILGGLGSVPAPPWGAIVLGYQPFWSSGAARALAASGCGPGRKGGGGGCTAAQTPGVTAGSVTIGSHQPLTGPAAPGYSEIAPAAKAMFSYINDNGGINGRKIKYIYKDDTYDPTRTVNVVKELVLQDKVFAIFNGLGTPTHAAVTDYLNAQKVPDLFVASGALQWDQ